MGKHTSTLEMQIKEFEQQRDRVRSIIGQIGGKPTFLKKFSNVVFMILVLAAFGLSIVAKDEYEVILLELIVLIVSAKFVYFLYMQARVTHFQFWILSSIEWQVNEMSSKLDKIVTEWEND